ncbi:MAG: hypothetical protein UV74_C0013G0249 [Candidatus Woesebacteria bacterium GW2011_GWB1_43_14]|uniref:Uncharacterized protein n=1 Tax=Candidatus Woesebacteria bacterium GW2011_GWB1_43_14 TaxID=1618578 RepID=A0A0G1DHU3_9BACT|nr:MAG: hypothetical protein UT21_C0002G0044 [Candidatus Woesebacteria bacterium GW2011_GWA1_39_11b]KKS78457.1 MAG: hypothetical protein UV51_C0001G0173 [Candidatus Woesebacteria bacterium GW2011_GWC1_42_9]KKS97127.1 MAG: hypothetical protein UV74_C0013G0249 [Candidatus Woesebacteria bacterium GW2011_GWB1_43_14]
MSQTTEKTILLPKTNWKKVLPYIRTAGETGAISHLDLGDDYLFWEELGVFSDSATGELSELGRAIFESLFIRCDGGEKELLKQMLLFYPPTIAIQQYLWGVANITVEQVLTVLKTTGFWFYDSREPLTHLLDFMNYAEIINYNKKTRIVRILISPDSPQTPRNIFIDPNRPFSNIMWIKKVLGECEGGIYWLDKHFQKEALEWLWAIADASKIKQIRIISLDLGEGNLNTTARKDLTRFKQEMANKNIDVSWATIDSKLVRDAHDRWIIDDVDYARNVPNVNAISSGQRSEINLTENYDEIKKAFDEYWNKSVEIV